MKTIKEVAEQAGVSKTAIYTLIKNHGIPTNKVDGLTYLDEQGLSLVLAHYASKKHETLKDIIQDADLIDSQVENKGLIGVLEKQLDEKQEVILGLLRALDNEQKLRAVPLLDSPQAKKQGVLKWLKSKFEKR